MNLPQAIRTLESFGLAPTVLHLGEPATPVTGLVLVDSQAIPVNDGWIRRDDIEDIMEDLADDDSSDH